MLAEVRKRVVRRRRLSGRKTAGPRRPWEEGRDGWAVRVGAGGCLTKTLRAGPTPSRRPRRSAWRAPGRVEALGAARSGRLRLAAHGPQPRAAPVEGNGSRAVPWTRTTGRRSRPAGESWGRSAEVFVRAHFRERTHRLREPGVLGRPEWRRSSQALQWNDAVALPPALLRDSVGRDARPAGGQDRRRPVDLDPVAPAALLALLPEVFVERVGVRAGADADWALEAAVRLLDPVDCEGRWGKKG